MTASPAAAGEAVALDATVDDLLRVAETSFVDLGYVAPDGLLDLALEASGVLALRLDVPTGRSLQLQSIAIDAGDADDVAALATVVASSWDGDLEAAFLPARLFDLDRPTGTLIRTRADRPGWVELRFARPLTLTRLRLRNVSAETAAEAERTPDLGQDPVAVSGAL